jgi:hypothetical protein
MPKPEETAPTTPPKYEVTAITRPANWRVGWAMIVVRDRDEAGRFWQWPIAVPVGTNRDDFLQCANAVLDFARYMNPALFEGTPFSQMPLTAEDLKR